ncbi:hypothetical protein K9N68_24170 [Kovacikia minuta CCNUW1]|uniref:hypothetical protein n=1 Tax=Kovacikia minuta TaxID=2931930 RepID=UPI001CCB7F99|nr:hypothetical protein [Kovacikia minuta]UBF24740.1 hypothetical protein K9N68_24170 [Kovacikia minuta CCNUW1]
MVALNRNVLPTVLLSGAIATGVFGFGLKAEAESLRQPIGPQAIWQPGMSEMREIRTTCAPLDGKQFGACFANGMQKFGASPEAVAFTHKTNNDGYMRDFRPVGRVSIAYIYFPFRANENQGGYLVNGTPDLIDIDNQSLLSKGELTQNPVYLSLRRKYPEIMMFTGDRAGTDYLKAETLPQGGQRFIVPYSLRNQCHACALVGTANFAFNFNNSGKFLGTQLINVVPAEKI